MDTKQKIEEALELVAEAGVFALDFGAGKMRKLGPSTIFPNQVYYMGASSDPNGIFVTKVTDEAITYRDLYSMGSERRVQRPIGDDLIQKGSETWLKGPYGKHFPREAKKLRTLLAGKKQPPANPADYMRHTVKVVAVNPPTGKVSRANDPYYKAEQYGNVGIMKDPKRGDVYEISSVTGKKLKKLKADKAFKILSTKPYKAHR